jgi:hypothetical protein
MPNFKPATYLNMNSSRHFLKIFLLVLILLTLFSPVLYWFSLNGNWKTTSDIEGRKLAVFPKHLFLNQRTAIKRVFQGLINEAVDLFFNNMKDRSLQNQLEFAVADQFPLRITLTEFSRFFERELISAAYSIFPDRVLPTSLNTSIYVTKDRSRLLPEPESFNTIKKQVIDLRIANYVRLLNDNPNTNFYMLNIETIPYSKFHPLATSFINSDSGRSLNYFIENKPKKLHFDNFGISSFQDYETNFFKTDHHWNIKGALIAYKLVYEMIASEYKDISPIVDVSKVGLVKGVKFLGSYARGSLYPIKPEPFEYVDFSLPEFKTYMNDHLITYGRRDQYLSGNFSKEKYYNHYQGFYGSWKKLLIYEFQNSSKRNLLIITSSHARMNQMLIASHYRKTYVVDLRGEVGKSISLKQMIKDYKIDDVLILGQPSITYLSSDYLITP